MRLGVLGGTFDPPHVGHLIVAEFAREQLHLDSVRFIPAGDPWRKAGRDIAAAAHRLAMTRLAVADNESFAVDDREVRRSGPSYTVDTLREIKEQSLPPGGELFFILGEDALADLPYWRDPAAIAALARIAVVPRAGNPPVDLLFVSERVVRVEMPYIGINSTLVRERARLGLSLRYLVAPAVAMYIKEQGLYTHG